MCTCQAVSAVHCCLCCVGMLVLLAGCCDLAESCVAGRAVQPHTAAGKGIADM